MGNNEVSKAVNFQMIVKTAMNLPGVQIKREDFLRNQLSSKFKPDIVELAIEKNPAYAGIGTAELESIAKSCIDYETNSATAVSFATGIPGGLWAFGTIPADLAQYYARLIRMLQKLVYLYGWPELYNSDGEFDDETQMQLILFIGVMVGVGTANTAVATLARTAAVKVEKDLARKALTKGTIYPIVKKVAGILGVKMTKEVFAKGVGKFVPVLGGFVSGALTYATFKPMSWRLKDHLEKLPTADIEFNQDSIVNETATVEPDFSDFEDYEYCEDDEKFENYPDCEWDWEFDEVSEPLLNN